MVEVSVVLPCLNEAEGVGICIRKIQEVFRNEGIIGEIIVVDNGCTDRTVEIALGLGYDNVRVVSENKKGYGSAYLCGFKYARGDVIVMGDADDSYDFYDIPRFLLALKDSDFVVGNRNVVLRGAMPYLHRRVGQPMFYAIMRYALRIPISDSHCGFGVIRRVDLDKLGLASSGMEFASEILIKAKKKGLLIREIPIVYSPRLGTSKLRTFRDGARHLRLIAKELLH